MKIYSGWNDMLFYFPADFVFHKLVQRTFGTLHIDRLEVLMTCDVLATSFIPFLGHWFRPIRGLNK
jgi:hypothetical protein